MATDPESDTTDDADGEAGGKAGVEQDKNRDGDAELELDDLRERGERRDVPVEDLTVDPANPNQMSDANFDLLKHRIRERGWVGGPIIANAGDLPGYDGDVAPDGLVSDGNHRLQAAAELGLTEVPALLVDFEDDAERRLWRQEMNKNRRSHEPEQDGEDIQAILGSRHSDDLMDLVDATGDDLGDILDGGDPEDADGLPDIDTPDGEIEGPGDQSDFLVVTLEVPVGRWDDARPELEAFADDHDADFEVA